MSLESGFHLERSVGNSSKLQRLGGGVKARAAVSALVVFSGAWLLIIDGADGASGQTIPVPVVPLPVKAAMVEGTPFRLTPSTLIVFESNRPEGNEVAARAVE